MNQLATTVAAVMLTGLGCLQMMGDLTHSKVLKALGAASQASPAPKVFTAHEGFETFSSQFYLQWRSRDGVAHSLQLTPEIYGRLHGPYNRRNAYGAALSYGPVLAANPLTQPMFASVSRYALCGRAPVLRELGSIRHPFKGQSPSNWCRVTLPVPMAVGSYPLLHLVSWRKNNEQYHR
jgi:hypothetical protein